MGWVRIQADRLSGETPLFFSEIFIVEVQLVNRSGKLLGIGSMPQRPNKRLNADFRIVQALRKRILR